MLHSRLSLLTRSFLLNAKTGDRPADHQLLDLLGVFHSYDLYGNTNRMCSQRLNVSSISGENGAVWLCQSYDKRVDR